MFKIVAAKARAQRLCGVCAFFFGTIIWVLGLRRRKRLGAGNDARCTRRAEIGWLQWIFEFPAVYIACPAVTSETGQAVLVDETLTVLLGEKLIS